MPRPLLLVLVCTLRARLGKEICVLYSGMRQLGTVHCCDEAETQRRYMKAFERVEIAEVLDPDKRLLSVCIDSSNPSAMVSGND